MNVLPLKTIGPQIPMVFCFPLLFPVETVGRKCRPPGRTLRKTVRFFRRAIDAGGDV